MGSKRQIESGRASEIQIHKYSMKTSLLFMMNLITNIIRLMKSCSLHIERELLTRYECVGDDMVHVQLYWCQINDAPIDHSDKDECILYNLHPFISNDALLQAFTIPAWQMDTPLTRNRYWVTPLTLFWLLMHLLAN